MLPVNKAQSQLPDLNRCGQPIAPTDRDYRQEQQCRFTVGIRWAALQETLHLLSVPGMRESIREGLATPIAACDRELKW